MERIRCVGLITCIDGSPRLLISDRSPEKLHARRDNFRAVMFATIGAVIPWRVTDPTLDEGLPPFLEVLTARQRQLAGRDDTMPRDMFLPVAVSVDVRLVGRERKIHNGHAAGGVTRPLDRSAPTELIDNQQIKQAPLAPRMSFS